MDGEKDVEGQRPTRISHWKMVVDQKVVTPVCAELFESYHHLLF